MIYYKISELLKSSGKSYRQLAKDTGISYVTISKLANAVTNEDYEVCTGILDKLCAYFKKQPGQLMTFLED